MSTGERRAELDGVRGVAILLVLIGHGGVPYALGPLAAAGVTLFFVLSGYLITGILASELRRHGRIRIGRFYARRMTRLGPPLLVMLAVVAVAAEPTVGGLLMAATWTSNYAGIAGVDVSYVGHTWSLGVEEQFYLLWPVALLTMFRRGRVARSVFWLCAALIAWRVLLTVNGELQYAYTAIETAGSAILVGALVRLVDWRIRGRWAALSLAAVPPLIVAGYLTIGPDTWLVVPLLTTIPAAAIVASSASARWLTWRPLTFCGVTSYSLYLWHTPLSFMVEGREGPVGVVAGVAVGLVAYFAVEAPLMWWRSANPQRAVARLDRPRPENALPARDPEAVAAAL